MYTQAHYARAHACTLHGLACARTRTHCSSMRARCPESLGLIGSSQGIGTRCHIACLRFVCKQRSLLPTFGRGLPTVPLVGSADARRPHTDDKVSPQTTSRATLASLDKQRSGVISFPPYPVQSRWYGGRDRAQVAEIDPNVAGIATIRPKRRQTRCEVQIKFGPSRPKGARRWPRSGQAGTQLADIKPNLADPNPSVVACGPQWPNSA